MSHDVVGLLVDRIVATSARRVAVDGVGVDTDPLPTTSRQISSLTERRDFSIFLDVPFTETARRMAARDGFNPDPEHSSMRRYVEGNASIFASARRASEPRSSSTTQIRLIHTSKLGRSLRDFHTFAARLHRTDPSEKILKILLHTPSIRPISGLDCRWSLLGFSYGDDHPQQH